MEQNLDIQSYMDGLLNEKCLSVKHYTDLMKGKFDLEKELKAKVQEVENYPNANVIIDSHITDQLHDEADKQHFAEIMKSYLLLKQKAYLLGKDDIKRKIADVKSLIQNLNKEKVDIENQFNYLFGWKESELANVENARQEISFAEADIQELLRKIKENEDWIKNIENLTYNAKKELERVTFEIAENDKKPHNSKMMELIKEETQILHKLDDVNKKIDEAKNQVDGNRQGSRNLIAIINDKINLCKGLEGKIKNSIDEFNRKDERLKQNKQGIVNLQDKLNETMRGLNSL